MMHSHSGNCLKRNAFLPSYTDNDPIRNNRLRSRSNHVLDFYLFDRVGQGYTLEMRS